MRCFYIRRIGIEQNYYIYTTQYKYSIQPIFSKANTNKELFGHSQILKLDYSERMLFIKIKSFVISNPEM
jgi:hypothetical protein